MKDQESHMEAFDAPKFASGKRFFFLLLLLVCLLLSILFIPFPHYIEASGEVSTATPVRPLIAKNDGRIELQAASGDVSSNEVLFQLSDAFSVQELHQAVAWVNQLKRGALPDPSGVEWPAIFGEDWVALVARFESQQLNKLQQVFLQLKDQKSDAIKQIDEELNQTDELIDLTKSELELVEARFKENQALYTNGGISKQALEAWEKEVLFTAQKLLGYETTAIQLEGSREQLLHEVLKEEKGLKLSDEEAVIFFERDCNALIKRLNQEIRRNEYKTAISGELTWSQGIKSGSYVQIGSVLGYVKPAQANWTIVANIQAKDYHLLDVGQAAKVYLNAFPKRKFGYLSTSIDQVELIKNTEGYSIEIPLNSNQTNRSKNLALQMGMAGQVKIEVGKQTFLDRLME